MDGKSTYFSLLNNCQEAENDIMEGCQSFVLGSLCMAEKKKNFKHKIYFLFSKNMSNQYPPTISEVETRDEVVVRVGNTD